MRLLALPLLAAFTASLPAQDPTAIARRVAQVRDGEVRMQYASRPGTCGDGKDMVAYRDAFFAKSMQGYGRWSGFDCAPGPVRVTLTREGGELTRVRTQVGGRWQGSAAADLGAVPARDAAAYFLSLVPRLDESGASVKGRVLLPAVLADSAQVAQPLLAIARDERRQRDTRRQALNWAGMLGDASIVPAIAALARADDGDEKKSFVSAVAASLTFVPDNAGVPALIGLAREGSVGMRREAVFWLAQTDDRAAHAAVRRAAEDANEDMRVREHAVFAIAHGEPDDADFDWLRTFWSRAGSDRLKEKVAQGMAEDERADAGRWLLDRVRDAREPLQVRKQTLFWAGQREETPTRDLVAVVREVREPELAKHGVFVLSQRRDDAAVDALVAIARGQGDPAIRKQALFWLGQSDHPRAERLLRELLSR